MRPGSRSPRASSSTTVWRCFPARWRPTAPPPPTPAEADAGRPGRGWSSEAERPLHATPSLFPLSSAARLARADAGGSGRDGGGEPCRDSGGEPGRDGGREPCRLISFGFSPSRLALGTFAVAQRDHGHAALRLRSRAAAAELGRGGGRAAGGDRPARPAGTAADSGRRSLAELPGDRSADRKGGAEGKRLSVRLDLGGRR